MVFNTRLLSSALSMFIKCNFFSWQRTFMGWCASGKSRATNRVVFDHHGNSGKSIMIEYMLHLGLAFQMPLLRGKSRIAHYASRVKHHQMYVVDAPPGGRENTHYAFLSEVALLKNVTLFTDVIPSKAILEKGNWQVWELTKEKTLKRHTFL